jgi:hypothetical protein
MSIKSFLIEYGVDPTNLTEKRTMAGGDIKTDEKRSTTIRDLIPGIPYYVQVTPIAQTGDPMTDLIMKGQATPLSSDGTHYAASDQLPPGLLNHPSSQQQQPSPPTPTPDTGLHQSGIPPLAWYAALAITALVILFEWRRRRSVRRTQQFLHSMRTRYHS